MRNLGGLLLLYASAAACVDGGDRDHNGGSVSRPGARSEASHTPAPTTTDVVDRIENAVGHSLRSGSAIDDASHNDTVGVVTRDLASDHVDLVDRRTGFAARFKLVDARPTRRRAPRFIPSSATTPHDDHHAPRVDVFERSWRGVGDVVRVRLSDGIEDYVVIDHDPAVIGDAASRSRLDYDLEVPNGSGLRLIENVLEMIDESGAPRLRVSPPWGIDGNGARVAMTLVVEGCAVDRSPQPPWGRPITPLERASSSSSTSSSCRVAVTWPESTTIYPLIVDPAWRGTKNLAQRRDQALVFSLGSGKVLAVGGYDGVNNCPQLAPELFNLANETWTTLSSNSECQAGVVLSGDKVLLASGSTSRIIDASTGSWSPTTALANGEASSMALLASGKVISVGRNGAQIYDPIANAWSAGAANFNFATERRDVGLASFADGSALAIGGWNFTDTELKTSEIWSPQASSWSAGPSLTTGAGGSSLTKLLDGRLLVAGGGGTLDTAEIYDPTTKKLTPTTKLNEQRIFHTTTTLTDGRVLVAGGGSDPPVDTAEIFDPVRSKWLRTGNLRTRRTYHSAAALPGGRALLVGGFGFVGAVGSRDYLADVDIYEPIALGGGCTGDGDCATGNCVDGVCCDQACRIACHACSAAKKGHGADGVCEPVPAGVDPTGRCLATPEATCGTTGICRPNGICAVHPVDTPCGESSCSEAVSSSARCNGEGACIKKVSACSPFACAEDKQCVTACKLDPDCAANFVCEPQSKGCIPSPVRCVDSHVLRNPDSTLVDCAPFMCVTGKCSKRCTTALECAPGAACNREGVCVSLESVHDASDPGGCAVGTTIVFTTTASNCSRRSGGLEALLLGLIVCASIVSRRRRRT